jgi:hypothetical protein
MSHQMSIKHMSLYLLHFLDILSSFWHMDIPQISLVKPGSKLPKKPLNTLAPPYPNGRGLRSRPVQCSVRKVSDPKSERTLWSRPTTSTIAWPYQSAPDTFLSDSLKINRFVITFFVMVQRLLKLDNLRRLQTRSNGVDIFGEIAPRGRQNLSHAVEESPLCEENLYLLLIRG